jgi:hypothetical protein
MPLPQVEERGLSQLREHCGKWTLRVEKPRNTFVLARIQLMIGVAIRYPRFQESSGAGQVQLKLS